MSAAFFRLYEGLPRQGPGDRASLDRALADLRVPPDGRVLDAGCGAGADIAGLLAHVPGGEVVAIDSHAPFVAAAAACHSGDARVQAIAGDMADPPGSFELIWCAGAIYFLGIRAGLEGWRAQLAPGGAVAFTELAWKGDDRPPAAVEFWQAEYPPMTDAAGVRAQVAAAGFEVLDSFFLPDAAWEAYLGPLAARAAALKAGNPGLELAEEIAAAEREIARWRADRGAMGYLQVIAVPR